MATAYSNDLRRKLLEAHSRKEGSLTRLAERFSVSVAWAKKISAHLRRTGQMERFPGGPCGPASKITAKQEQELKDWIAEEPDLTLAEMRLRLYEQYRLEISLSRLWTVLESLGLRLKKNRFMPPSKTPMWTVFNGQVGATAAKRLRLRS